MSGSEAQELLTANLPVVERAVAFAARRYRLDPADAEEFAAVVKLRLVDNDYAILRAYEERSSFSTYISIVVQRMALDFRIHAWGKWHSSAEAKRLGPLALELEKLLHRDGRTIEDSEKILATRYPEATRQSLVSLAARLPERAPKRRDVALEEAESVAVTRPAEVEEPVFADERRRTSERVSSIMAAVMSRLPEDQRLILQLRFEGGMTVAQIARSLGVDQKLTYRQIERNMRDFRRELERFGIASGDVADLIGRDEVLLHFDLGNQNRRPSLVTDERAAHSEDAP
ncbi:MAG TPA: sigma-70 family RNA polymerase sigma factor [Thermoanaerobaculia bacterium]|nr:sigma-70 family RNA polymerase sigma factor [Thermoanaerobaculia bacterium]